MRGKLKNFVEEKSYGFIKGDDKQDYFFHTAFLNKEFKDTKIVTGMMFDFDPTPTPKGLAAKKASIIKTFSTETPINGFKNHRKKKVKALEAKPLRTQFYKSPDDAFNRLETIAKESNANTLYDTKLNHEVWSNGNYKYKMFSAEGYVGIQTKTVQLTNENEIEAHTSKLTLIMNEFNNSYYTVKSNEEALIDKQKSNVGGLIFFIIFVIILLSIVGSIA